MLDTIFGRICAYAFMFAFCVGFWACFIGAIYLLIVRYA